MTPGFPAVGRTVPAAAVTVLIGVVGALASLVVIGVSGWLVVALLLTVGAAALPRTPFAAILSVMLGLALVIDGDLGYTPAFVVLLAAIHLLLVAGQLAAWLPLRARVQVAVLRPPLVRYVLVQVAAQVVAFVVLTFARPVPGSAPGAGALWLGLVGGVAAVLLAVAVLIPLLLRPTR
ncbi:hypothetical protein EDF46_1463 [Frondihabitans sp. PhB188]|uniref:hypothetical protein n=1 Tax=Frondihabitans sp. PhB188 TaxID=2485200 RepID=UPI000F467E1B|nr:hypothetical protein [Frondihabitans sp. PhB188]ROQ39828.1 hypothetical protein EDF46_1463 [Frondihabitans sp. PhB188]